MHNPKLFLKSAVTSECIKLGIEIQNKPLKNHKNRPLDTFNTYSSPALLDLVECDYQSNNNYAEHLLMETISNQNKMVSLDKAPSFLELFGRENLGLTDFTFKDGSGLSRLNLSSQNLFNQLLYFQLNSKPYIKEIFLNSLHCGCFRYFKIFG